MKVRTLAVVLTIILCMSACGPQEAGVGDIFVSTDFIGVLGFRPAEIVTDEIVQAYYKDLKLSTNLVNFLAEEAEARGQDGLEREQVVWFILPDGKFAVMESSTPAPSLERMKLYLGEKARWSNFSANEDGSMAATLPDAHGSAAPETAEHDAILKIDNGKIIYGSDTAVEALKSTGTIDEFKSSIMDLVDFDAAFYVLISDPEGIPYMAGSGNMQSSRSDQVHDIQAIGFSFNLGDPVQAVLNVQCADAEAATDLKNYLETLGGDVVEIARAFVHPMIASVALVDKRELLGELEHKLEITQDENRVSVRISAENEILAMAVEGYGAKLTQKFYQQNSVGKVKSLGSGLELYLKNHSGESAPNLASIEELGKLLEQDNQYVPFDFMKDGWGNTLVYERLDGGGYRIVCLGADGKQGDSGSKWDADIIWENGTLLTEIEETMFR